MAADLEHIKQKIVSEEYEAFRELYLLMYTPLMRFANIYTHNSHMAEDVLADVFLKLWDRRHSLQNVKNLRVYLYTAVKNTALNQRSRQAKITEDTDELSELQSAYPDPESIMLSAETSHQIQKAIHQLPPRCKLIFQLAREEGMRYKEISNILDISVKTIDNQLAIALSKIGNAILDHQKHHPG